MRIWDLPPRVLCRQHLLGEHRELHAIWSIYDNDRKGYRNHPETIRWQDHLPALALRHDALVVEMKRRGYNHASPLPHREAWERMGHFSEWPASITPLDQQRAMLCERCEHCRARIGRSEAEKQALDNAEYVLAGREE